MLDINVLKGKLKDISYRVITANKGIDLRFKGIEEAIEKELGLQTKFSSSGWHTVHNLTLTRIQKVRPSQEIIVSRIEVRISYQVIDDEVVVDIFLSI